MSDPEGNKPLDDSDVPQEYPEPCDVCGEVPEGGEALVDGMCKECREQFEVEESTGVTGPGA